MRPVVVSYIIIQVRYPAQKPEKLQLVQLNFFEYAFFCHYVSNCGAQLLALHVGFEVENIKTVLLNFFKFLYCGRRTFHLLLNNLRRYDSRAHELVSWCQRLLETIFL